MRPILIALIALFAFATVSEAGPIRRVLGRGKSAAGKVVQRAAHPFGGCRGGSCGR